MLFTERELNVDFMEYLFDDRNVPSTSTMNQLMSSSSSPTTFAMLTIKKYQERSNNMIGAIPSSLLISPVSDDRGSEPCFPPGNKFANNVSLFLITFWSSNVELFGCISLEDVRLGTSYLNFVSTFANPSAKRQSQH